MVIWNKEKHEINYYETVNHKTKGVIFIGTYQQYTIINDCPNILYVYTFIKLKCP